MGGTGGVITYLAHHCDMTKVGALIIMTWQKAGGKASATVI